jgi:hypothetical protein
MIERSTDMNPSPGQITGEPFPLRYANRALWNESVFSWYTSADI